jgi:ribosomal protein S2
MFNKVELVAVLSALVFVIGLLWNMKIAQDKSNEERLTKYEKGLESSRNTILQLTKDYAKLEGRLDGIENLSRRVLNEIRSVLHKDKM